VNKRIIALILICAMASCLCGGLAEEGTTADPVVTLSYLNETYIPTFKQNADKRIDAALAKDYNSAFADLALTAGSYNRSYAASDLSIKEIDGPLALKKDDVLTSSGAIELTLLSGSAKAFGSVYAGDTLLKEGALLKAGTVYSVSDLSGISISTEVATFTARGAYTLSYSDEVDYTSCADALFTMGLFRGRTTGYALSEGATRAEGLVMFLRLIGEEDEALTCTEPQPFSDASWADRYIAYAYAKGYTKGESATRFGTDSPLSSAHYVTFLLRSLGYTEGEDFAWKTVMEDALRLGVISAAEKAFLEKRFTRAQVAYLSYWALFLTLDGESESILTRLINTGSVAEYAAINALCACRAARIE